VTVAAANDADEDDETATVTISAPEISPRVVTVKVKDSALKAPLITSAAKVTAVAGAPYVYVVTASGNPEPTFSLTAAPAGMTIDGATGAISWTPASVGSVAVTVRATNGVAPNATQSFNIAVSADTPPVAVLTEPKEGATLSGEHGEFYGDCIDDVFCTKAQFFIDGVLSYTDENAFNHYHFGSAHAQFNTYLAPNGPHKLRMTVTDTTGKTAEQEVNVVVANEGGAPDAGSDGGSNGGGPGPDGAVTNDGGVVAEQDEPAVDSGCSCRSSTSAGAGGSIMALVGVAAAFGFRRRRSA
jgi:MYXO-CTERM domain-containing protein